MFKMGCSMARRILTPGSATSGDQQQAGCFSTAPMNSAGGNKSASGRQAPDQANPQKASQPSSELDDFSKLKEDPRLPLNVRQIFKITKSWKAIARTTSKTGTAMFLALFEQNENLFHLFDRFQHLKGKELHESMELREHAATVMATLDTSINSLSDYDNFVSYLHSIGQLHRKVPGFKREYFWEIEQPFMKAVKQTLDERCNETIEEIYKIAIKLIIETIAVGYGEDQDDKQAGKRSAPGAPDKSRQGGGSDGSAEKGGAGGPTSNVTSHRGPASAGQSISRGGGGQRARQCQQTPSCPLVLAERALWRLGRATNKSRPARSGGGGPTESSGELVRATCKLMSATERLASSCGESELHEQDGAKLMNWRALLVKLNRSLMNDCKSEQRTQVEHKQQQQQQQQQQANQPEQRRLRPARFAQTTRSLGCPVLLGASGRADDPMASGNGAGGFHDDDDCRRDHLEAERVGAHLAQRELDRTTAQLGDGTRETADEEKRPTRAIDPIESQAANRAAAAAAYSRQNAAQDKPKRCPKLREHLNDEQTTRPDGGLPRDRRKGGAPSSEGPNEGGLGSNEAILLLDGETSLRGLLLDIKQAERAPEVVDAELIEFIKVIILISKLVLALVSSREATKRATLATAFMTTTTTTTTTRVN